MNSLLLSLDSKAENVTHGKIFGVSEQANKTRVISGKKYNF